MLWPRIRYAMALPALLEVEKDVALNLRCAISKEFKRRAL